MAERAPLEPGFQQARLGLSTARAGARSRRAGPLAGPLAAATVAALVVLFASGTARAEHRLEWNEHWPRFRIVEYGVTALLLFEYTMLEFQAKYPDDPRVTGSLPLEQEARSIHRLDDPEARAIAGMISDPITLSVQLWPLVIDSVVVPVFFDDWNFDVAFQMTMMNLEAMGAGGFLTRAGHLTVARARPNAEECRKDKSYGFCASGSYASFPSGHTSGAFIGAGLMCAHHFHLPLYGGGAPDAVACAVPLALGTASGILRLMGDRHHTTDVLTGAVIGFGAGWGVPVALHYGFGWGHDDVRVLPSATEDEVSLTLSGSM